MFVFLLHLPLLRLPYFWDEAGYYVPAARDILLTGSLIPHSTLSNAHPPLVMAWLALWWKVVGYTPLVTRTAMLFLAAFSLLGFFRLAEDRRQFASCDCSYAVHRRLPCILRAKLLGASRLTRRGPDLLGSFGLYRRAQARHHTMVFPRSPGQRDSDSRSPGAGCLGIAGFLAQRTSFRTLWRFADTRPLRVVSRLIPAVPLAFWYAYHYARMGYVFGNPEFFRYNVAATLSPTRFVLALLMRLWQISGYLHLWVLTLAMLLALWMLPPLRDSTSERPRITIPLQMIFYVVILTYIVAMALIGGAVLARYMLPAVPLIILVSVSTLWRRVEWWPAAIAFVVLAFVAAWFWNPPYGFSPEDNLAYRDYIVLHENSEQFLDARYPMARVLTAWPASDELTRPWLGYITRPMSIVRIEDFSLDEILSSADFRAHYDVALIFSTKYEPGPTRWDHWRAWTELKTKFFGFHRDLPPAAVAHILGGRIVFSQERQGQWVAVIEMQQNELQNAEVRTQE